MMSQIYFNSRKGQTVLSPSEKRGLRFSHIVSMKELNQAEQSNIQEGLFWLSGHKGDFIHDAFFSKLHKKLFGKVWKWAGVYRQTEKNIGIDYFKIPIEIKKLCDDLAFWIEHQTYESHELLARFHHRLVYIHPYPNGNGRFSRILTNYLSQRQGWGALTWMGSLDPIARRELYINALREADIKNYEPLLDFFNQSLKE